ncbi:MAG TPA: helix-turn-helix transcriptional regulator, partial [Limosilactobacillus oris]|uniref:helix-turn-helix domain-containing protein n=1 Tax=Limosilactobacillus oris TaxID=1632 RepID=UPI001DE98268
MKEGVDLLANRLKILLAERDLSIKEVVEDTGISRSALSNMVNNPSANIATKNIDTLCNFLEINPSDFWEYSPWIFRYFTRPGNDVEDDGLAINSTVALEIQAINGKIKEHLNFVFLFYRNDNIDIFDGTAYSMRVLYDSKGDFEEIFNSLSPVFRHSIQSKIVETARGFLESAIQNHELDPNNIEGEPISIDVCSDGNIRHPLFVSKLTMNGL